MTELAIRDIPVLEPNGYGRAVTAAPPDTDSWIKIVSDVINLANVICETDFVPKAYRNNGAATAAAILAGRELGLPPMTALRHVQVVEGSPSLSAEYKRARVLAAGHDIDIVELNTTRCKLIGRRKGKPPLPVEFSMDDARRAHLVKPRGAWETRPRRMLFARASTEVCDFLFTDITNGLPTAELLMEGIDDPYEGYNEPPDPAKPRTAQRKPRTQNASPAPPAAATHSAGQTPYPPVTAESAGEALPPLPGEEEDPAPAAADVGADAPGAVPDDTDWDTPGTATSGEGGQLTAIWTILGDVYGFTHREKDKARKVCAHIAGHDLETSSNLSYNEAKTVLDTLGNWQAVANSNGEEPRKVLDTILADAGEAS